MIAGLYARVSTGNQEVQETIGSQLDEVKGRIETDGNILPQDNIFSDDGWTGEMLQRPGLDAMRDAVHSGRFEVLYVYDRGRLSRMFFHQEIILEELEDRGIKFVSLHDINALTPEEHVLQSMQGVFAQYERIKIAERFRRGKLYKARMGTIINGQAPYGYTYIPKNGDQSARIIINEEEARVVRMIFNWVGVECVSLREVIRRLKHLGIPPRKGKRDVWTKGPLVRLLERRTYFDGLVYYNKTEAIVARKPTKNTKYKKIKRTSRKARPVGDWISFNVPKLIVEEWLFEKVQKALANNKLYASKNKKYDYLLTGLVYCECGRRRTGDTSNQSGHHYYRCTDRILSFPEIAECKASGVNAAVLDGLFWLKLREFLGDPVELRKRAEEWLGDKVSLDTSSQSEKQMLIRESEGLKEEGLRYAKAYGAGALAFEQFRELSEEIKKKDRSIQTQIKELDKKRVPAVAIDEATTDKLCSSAQFVLGAVGWEDKKKLVHDIISHVNVFDGGEVEVKGHLPLFDQKVGYEPIYRNCGITQCR